MNIKYWLTGFFLSVSLFIFSPHFAEAAITQVSNQNKGETGQSSLGNLSFSGGVTAGNQIIVVLQGYQNSSVPTLNLPTKVSGTATIGAFVQDATYTKNSGTDNFKISIFRAPVTGSGSLTLGFSGSFAYSLAAINEYAGMAASPVDVTVTNTTISNTESSGNINTTAPGMILMSSNELSPSNFNYVLSDTNVYNRSTGASSMTGEVQHKITGLPGTYNLTAGIGNSWFWIGLAVAYKANSASGIDTTPPTVSITAPLDGAFATGTSVSVSANAIDNVGIGGVQFKLDGANLGAEDVTAPYSVVWNSTTATNGSHALSAVARDIAGNTAVTTPVTVTVDNQAPSGTILINNNGATTNSTAVTLNLSATDNGGTVSQMRFSNTGTSWNAPVAYATTANWTITTGDGTKTVYAQFKDSNGNWSPSFTDTIVLDATAPTISAVSASGVTTNSAVISWTTDEPGTSQVNYGVPVTYGGTTLLDSTLVTSHSVTVSGLNPQTLYNYRVRSQDATGNEKVGSNATFTTLTSPDTTLPTTPTGLTAVAISTTQINLSWTASTDNVGVAGYKIFRDGVQVGTSAANSYSDTALSASTLYTYTVSAYDAAGNNSAQSTSANATTLTPSDTTAPSVPTNLSATAVSTSGINLSWTASTDAVGVTGYKIFRNGTQIGTSVTNSYSDSGLTPGTLYTYTVSAYDAAGNNSAQSTSASATTITPQDTTPPTTPTGLAATSVSASGVSLGWSASTDNVGVTGYKVFRNGVQVGTSGTNSYPDTGLAPSTSYTYTVSSYDAAGNNSGVSGSVNATTDPLPSSKFTIGQRVQTTGNLNVRSTPSVSGTLLGTQSTGVLGTVTSGSVVADGFNWWNINYDTGVDGWSVEDFLTWYVDTTAPSVPTNLSGVAVSSSGINLSWTASTDVSGVTGYKIYRGGIQVGTSGTNSYSDTGLTPSTSYTYTVSAYDAAGNNSAQSTSASATTQAVSSGNTYTTNFSLTENPISENGRWLNGATNGIDWANVRTSPGLVYGVNLPSQFSDPTAALTGTWGADQQAQATVRVTNPPFNCCHEVELRLRTTITSHRITGYEVLCSVVSSDPYVQIVRWNGPVNSFDYIDAREASCSNGDVFKATMIGNVITAYKNGVQVAQGIDNTFTGGSPGVGFYDNQDSNWSDFGFSDFFATDNGSLPPPQDTTAPSVPTNLSATAVSTSGINLSWTASTDAVGVTGYKIFRNGTQVATSATNAYSDTGLTPGTLYSYTVSAYDAVGNNSAQSTSASATTQAVSSDTTAPSVPTGLSATGISSSVVNLSWTASTDNVGVTGYKIFRNGTQVGTSVTTSYSDSGLSGSTSYNYTVSSYDAGNNNSAQSSVAVGTTLAVSPANLVGYWSLNEGSGTTVGDTSGNGYNATFVNSPVWTVGQMGNALSFNNTNNYVKTNSMINLGGPVVTFSAWVKGTGTVMAQSPNGASTAAWTLNISSTGQINMYANGWRFSNGSITPGVWNHIAIVGDTTTTKMYINGILDTSLNTPLFNTGTSQTPNNYFNIGLFPNNGTFFNGSIDEVRVYNRALSASEINSI